MRTVIAVASVVILIGVIVAGVSRPVRAQRPATHALVTKVELRAMAEGTFELGPLGQRR